MKNKGSDIFEFTNNNSNQSNFLNIAEDENPFMNLSVKQEGYRRLNDYDFNILKDGAYRDISDDAFKLECQISKKEEEIKIIESKISSAEEIQDTVLISELQNKLCSLKSEYNTLLALYNDKTLSAKITDRFSGFIGIINNIKQVSSNIFDLVISKLPDKLTSSFKIRKSLSVLANINKSVDELVTRTIPYGENIDKYKQLSKYIIKANEIQLEISGYLGKKN